VPRKIPCGRWMGEHQPRVFRKLICQLPKGHSGLHHAKGVAEAAPYLNRWITWNA